METTVDKIHNNKNYDWSNIDTIVFNDEGNNISVKDRLVHLCLRTLSVLYIYELINHLLNVRQIIFDTRVDQSD